MDDLETIGHFFYTKSSFVHHFKSIVDSKLELQSESAQFKSKLVIFVPVWPWNLMDDLWKQYGTCYILHQALSIISNPSLNPNLRYSSELSIWVEIGDILSRVTLKFDGWPWKTIGHLFLTTLSFVHHSKAMGEFKLELQSGNAQFGSKSTIFCPVWPWTLTDDLEKQ